MSPRTAELLIRDMLDRINRIQRYVSGSDRGAFLLDTKTSDSVVRNLEVIGEAAARLPEPFQTRCGQISHGEGSWGSGTGSCTNTSMWTSR